MAKSIFAAAHLVGYGTEAVLTISAQPFEGYHTFYKSLKNQGKHWQKIGSRSQHVWTVMLQAASLPTAMSKHKKTTALEDAGNHKPI